MTWGMIFSPAVRVITDGRWVSCRLESSITWRAVLYKAIIRRACASTKILPFRGDFKLLIRIKIFIENSFSSWRMWFAHRRLESGGFFRRTWYSFPRDQGRQGCGFLVINRIGITPF